MILYFFPPRRLPNQQCSSPELTITFLPQSSIWPGPLTPRVCPSYLGLPPHQSPAFRCAIPVPNSRSSLSCLAPCDEYSRDLLDSFAVYIPVPPSLSNRKYPALLLPLRSEPESSTWFPVIDQWTLQTFVSSQSPRFSSFLPSLSSIHTQCILEMP